MQDVLLGHVGGFGGEVRIANTGARGADVFRDIGLVANGGIQTVLHRTEIRTLAVHRGDQLVNVRQHRLHSDGNSTWTHHNYGECVYDMLSIFMRARSFVPDQWKKGFVVNLSIVDGDDRVPAQLRYDGKVNVEADNGKKYRCLRLSYLERDKGRYKRIVDFFVTDDVNHIPVRLDMYLRFGTAKAFLTGLKGNRNTITSEIN